MKVQIFYGSNYLPFIMYLNTLHNILKKKFANIEIIQNINQISEDTDFLFIYLNEIKKVYNLNYSNVKIIFIHADHIVNHSKSDQDLIKDYINNRNPKNTYIWEYNCLNIKYYKENNYVNEKIFYLPLTYDDYLENIYIQSTNKITWKNKDIDILFMGSTDCGTRRSKIMNNFQSKKNIKFKNVKNINDLGEFIRIIERSKIVINIYTHETNKPFDYYRLSLLLANKVFIINEKIEHIDNNIDYSLKNLINKITQFDYDNFVDKTVEFLNKEEEIINKINYEVYEEFKKISMENNILNFFTKIFEI